MNALVETLGLKTKKNELEYWVSNGIFSAAVETVKELGRSLNQSEINQMFDSALSHKLGCHEAFLASQAMERKLSMAEVDVLVEGAIYLGDFDFLLQLSSVFARPIKTQERARVLCNKKVIEREERLGDGLNDNFFFEHEDDYYPLKKPNRRRLVS